MEGRDILLLMRKMERNVIPARQSSVSYNGCMRGQTPGQLGLSGPRTCSAKILLIKDKLRTAPILSVGDSCRLGKSNRICGLGEHFVDEENMTDVQNAEPD